MVQPQGGSGVRTPSRQVFNLEKRCLIPVRVTQRSPIFNLFTSLESFTGNQEWCNPFRNVQANSSSLSFSTSRPFVSHPIQLRIGLGRTQLNPSRGGVTQGTERKYVHNPDNYHLSSNTYPEAYKAQYESEQQYEHEYQEPGYGYKQYELQTIPQHQTNLQRQQPVAQRSHQSMPTRQQVNAQQVIHQRQHHQVPQSEYDYYHQGHLEAQYHQQPQEQEQPIYYDPNIDQTTAADPYDNYPDPSYQSRQYQQQGEWGNVPAAVTTPENHHSRSGSRGVETSSPPPPPPPPRGAARTSTRAPQQRGVASRAPADPRTAAKVPSSAPQPRVSSTTPHSSTQAPSRAAPPAQAPSRSAPPAQVPSRTVPPARRVVTKKVLPGVTRDSSTSVEPNLAAIQESLATIQRSGVSAKAKETASRSQQPTTSSSSTQRPKKSGDMTDRPSNSATDRLGRTQLNPSRGGVTQGTERKYVHNPDNYHLSSNTYPEAYKAQYESEQQYEHEYQEPGYGYKQYELQTIPQHQTNLQRQQPVAQRSHQSMPTRQQVNAQQVIHQRQHHQVPQSEYDYYHQGHLEAQYHQQPQEQEQPIYYDPNIDQTTAADPYDNYPDPSYQSRQYQQQGEWGNVPAAVTTPENHHSRSGSRGVETSSPPPPPPPPRGAARTSTRAPQQRGVASRAPADPRTAAKVPSSAPQPRVSSTTPHSSTHVSSRAAQVSSRATPPAQAPSRSAPPAQVPSRAVPPARRVVTKKVLPGVTRDSSTSVEPNLAAIQESLATIQRSGVSAKAKETASRSQQPTTSSSSTQRPKKSGDMTDR
eukprot:sb/3462168/